jgi:UDP-N-acetylmuramoyl-L-alanyl-D-glutamate--2,6-diaminopimelate ligase
VRFSQILADLHGVERRGSDPDLSAVTDNSANVGPTTLFVAVPGYVTDGHRFVADAVRRGAAALLLQRDRLDQLTVPEIPLAIVPDSRSALAKVAAAFYGNPASHLRVIGVTGTDGKTTTCHLIDAVLEEAGHQTGLLGTVDFKIGNQWQPNDSRLTTPGALEVQRLLASISQRGADYAILESTSHGLELRRLDCCAYDIAVLTNLTPDHLDQHGTFEAYRAAKARLFEMLSDPTEKHAARYAVLNLDDSNYGYFRDHSGAPVISYGMSPDADVRATAVEPGPAATRFTVRAGGEQFGIELPMPGLFNVSNALAAIAAALQENIAPDTIARALSRFAGVPGRMQRIDCGQPFGVIVDYAHTGDALQKVLTTLRPGVNGRIIAVFGSAGERGHSRRSGMAAASAELADLTILTDEDPRSEDPASIVEEMATTLRAAGRQESVDFLCILDRQLAIDEAVRRAEPDDLVLIAGKGHEQSIEVGGRKLPWDDRAAVRRALAALGHRREQ